MRLRTCLVQRHTLGIHAGARGEVPAHLKEKGTVMRRITASAMAVPLVLLSIGVAHADSNDDDFVQSLNNVGVGGAPADLISNAHLVCTGLDNGNTPASIRDAFVSQTGSTPNTAATFVALSATHYCPQYSNLRF